MNFVNVKEYIPFVMSDNGLIWVFKLCTVWVSDDDFEDSIEIPAFIK